MLPLLIVMGLDPRPLVSALSWTVDRGLPEYGMNSARRVCVSHHLAHTVDTEGLAIGAAWQSAEIDRGASSPIRLVGVHKKARCG